MTEIERNDSLQSNSSPSNLLDPNDAKVLITLDHESQDCWINGYLCHMHRCQTCISYLKYINYSKQLSFTGTLAEDGSP